jgi:ankyrin repeat protein
LIDKGADVNVQGGEDGNALQTASYRGDQEIVKILIREKMSMHNLKEGYITTHCKPHHIMDIRRLSSC